MVIILRARVETGTGAAVPPRQGEDAGPGSNDGIERRIFRTWPLWGCGSTRIRWKGKAQADGKSAAASIGCEHFPEACDPPPSFERREVRRQPGNTAFRPQAQWIHRLVGLPFRSKTDRRHRPRTPRREPSRIVGRFSVFPGRGMRKKCLFQRSKRWRPTGPSAMGTVGRASPGTI